MLRMLFGVLKHADSQHVAVLGQRQPTELTITSAASVSVGLTDPWTQTLLVEVIRL